ncbi:MAG TPA: energy transducer TonB [Vicinamibacterales bacterium]|nr:energy transducer TonB [Vicinamibacterales bacterium]
MKFRGGALVAIVLTLLLAARSISAQGTDQNVHPATQQGLVPPTVLQQVKPQYTAEAMRARIQGTVRLRGVVERDGTVSNVEVVRSLDSQFGLDAGAIAMFKQWRFTPGMLNGQPVRVQVVVDLTYALRGVAVTGWPPGFDAAREADSRQEETVESGGLRVHFRRPADWVALARSTATPLMLRSGDGLLTMTLFAPTQTSIQLSRPVTSSQVEDLLKADGGSGAPLTVSGQVDSRPGLFWVWAERRSSRQQSWTYFHTEGDRLVTLTCAQETPPSSGPPPASDTAAGECAAIVNSIEVMPAATP